MLLLSGIRLRVTTTEAVVRISKTAHELMQVQTCLRPFLASCGTPSSSSSASRLNGQSPGVGCLGQSKSVVLATSVLVVSLGVVQIREVHPVGPLLLFKLLHCFCSAGWSYDCQAQLAGIVVRAPPLLPVSPTPPMVIAVGSFSGMDGRWKEGTTIQMLTGELLLRALSGYCCCKE
jgi:hypothetical protein